MKRVLKILSLLVFVVPMIAATTMYLATEKKYAFTAENLAATIPEFVEDENKQIEMAKKWVELADPDTGMLSIADMFSACRAGGFNTYREVGFTQCRALIVKLIENAEGELDEDFLNGYCPGLDEKGKNPNALSTITDKTRIGGHCSSKNIYAGEVTFRKGYNCTCTAYACNNGYELKKGQCVTLVADGQGNCLRKEFPKTDKVNTTAKAVEFCQDYATKNKCKLLYTNMLHSQSKIVCNPTLDEVDKVKAGMLANKDKQIAELKYYEVCGQHKGKTGKKEYCVENVFGDVDTGQNEGAGLAQLYAKEKQGKTIYCDIKYREKSNDDYMKCATLEKDTYYEFRFDDLSESSDDAKFTDTIMGIAAIYGYKSSSNIIKAPCNAKLQNAAKKMGMRASANKNECWMWHATQITSNKNLVSKLRSIDGLDCTIGKNVQSQGSTEVRNKLLSYIRAQGFVVTDFECDNGYGTVYNGVLSGSDDILTCRVSGTFNGKRYNKQPIDFIFDDMSEGKKYQQKAGDQGLNCIAYNGNFDGHYCRKLTKAECFQLEKEMLAELKRLGKYTGDNDLVDWDESAGACELNDAQVANNINKVGKYTAIVGLTVAGAFSGGTTSAVAVSLMAVELAGVVGEVYTERKVDLLPQEWANAFLAESRKCNNSSCAETTLRNNFQKIAQASDKLNRDVLNQVDTEMARLAEKIPDSRLQQILDTSEPPSCWDTWECQRWIFVGMQCASLVASVGNGLVKMTGVFSKKAAAAATKTSAKAATTTASHTDDVARGAVKSTKEELAEIGVAESKAYRDIKTGKVISKDEVLARIDKMPGGTGANKTLNEELAEIGVREESVYRDIASNKFISRDEVLRRIDEMPSSSSVPAPGGATSATPAPKANEKLLDIFNGASGAEAGRVVNAAEREYNVMDKMLVADGEFTTKLARIKNGTAKELVVPSNRLTEEEWKVLSDSLKKEGFEVVDYPGQLGLSQKGIRKIGGTSDAGRVVNGAGDVGRAVDGATNRAMELLDSETALMRRFGFNTQRDEKLLDFAVNYTDDVANATSQADEVEAWLKYHQNVVDYLATKFDKSKALRVAGERRKTYMDIIANDRDLSAKALNWKNISDAEKQSFLQTLVDRANRVHCNGRSCSVSVGRGIGNATDYMHGGDISIELGTLPAGYGHPVMRAGNNLDDAMTALSHEHAHSILFNAPAKSSIDERFVGMAIVHGEDDVGLTSAKLFGEPVFSKKGNYKKLLSEQEGFLVGETVGKNFERDLRARLGIR